MNDPPDPEELRAGALALLTSGRAQAALELATLRLQPGALSWEGSLGEVRGHRLTLGLDGASLGELDEYPSALDELEVALARVLGRHPGHSLAALETRWELEPAPEVRSYRTPERRPARRDDPEALRRALVAYLQRRDEEVAARWAAQASPLDVRKAPAALRGALTAALARLRAPLGAP